MEQKLIIKLTDDQDILELINAKLKETGGICPCVLLAPDASEEEKKKYTCMCEPFRKQNTEGPCHCGKYVKILIKK